MDLELEGLHMYNNLIEENLPELEDLWMEMHYWDVADVPEEVYTGELEWIPSNPHPSFHSTLVISTASPSHLDSLPEPTWRMVHQRQAYYGYRLERPTSTVEVERKTEVGTKMGRPASYNKALKLEYNLSRLVSGRNPGEVPNLFAVLDDSGSHLAEWYGHTFALTDLETLCREALQLRGMRWESLHPTFLSEGGSAMTEAQHRQRRDRAAAGRAVRSQKALESARELLELERTAPEELESFTGLSGASLTQKLRRARSMVAEADGTPTEEVIDMETGEVISETPETPEATPEASEAEPVEESPEVAPVPVDTPLAPVEELAPEAPEAEPVEESPQVSQMDLMAELDALLALESPDKPEPAPAPIQRPKLEIPAPDPHESLESLLARLKATA